MSDAKFMWAPASAATDWDRFVQMSPQGTLFSERTFLDLSGRRCETFLVSKGSHVKAGVAVVCTDDGRGCELDDLIIHSGLMFLPDPDKKAVRQRFEQFELTEFVIHNLVARYSPISLAMPPGIEDVRPFQWYNYHEPPRAPRFRCDIRYTSYVDISAIVGVANEEDTDAFRAMDTLRQRHVREARRNRAVLRVAGRTETLVAYYRALMSRQGDPRAEQDLARIQALMEGLVASGRGAVFEVVNQQGTVLYVVGYGWDARRAYYLFGAGNPAEQEPWQGTFAHWEAFRTLATDRGLREVDMEGVNSPKRGWFKLGFGGDLRPYFQISLERAEPFAQ